MLRRIENIDQLIIDLDTDAIVSVMNDLGFDQKKFSPNITWEEIRNMITERYNRSQKDLFDLEEAVLCASDLHRVVFTEDIIADKRFRCEEWIIPVESIFDHYNYNYIIDYIDESVSLDFEHYLDFSKRLGIQEDQLYEYRINSIFFNQFEDKILCLYQLINRNKSINKIKNSIKMKNS